MANDDQVVLRSYLIDHPRAKPLVDGEIDSAGIAWQWLKPPSGGFRGVSSSDADVFEYSLSGYLLDVAHGGQDRHDWVALPTFLSRAYDVVAGLVSRDSLFGWEALKGKRLAVPDVGMTAAIWIRVVLRELYGFEDDAVSWLNIRQPEEMHTEELGIAYGLPGQHVGQVPKGAKPIELVAAGELDATLGLGDPSKMPANVHRLADAARLRELSLEFTRRSGATLTNHVVLIRRSLLDERPGIDRTIYDLLEASKQRAYEQAREKLATIFVFPDAAIDAEREVFGEDPFPAGIKANRATLDALMSQLLAEGQLEAVLDDAAIFSPNLLAT